MLSGRNEKWYYRKAIAFSSLVALVLGQASVLARAGLGQSVSGIKTPETYAQLPSLSPVNPVLPLPPLGNPEQPLPPLGYPQQPSNTTPPDQFSRYRLGVGDAIAVTVPRFPDLSFQSNVDLEGNIVVPLVGTLPVSGLTLERVQAKIQAGLNRFVIDPQVIVSLAALRPAQVTITGEVLRPGYYPLQPGSQLSAALLAAGGTTTTADLRTIVVRRRSLVDNSFVEQQIDLFTPLQNGTSLPNLRLQDGDAVIVSKLEVGNTSDYDRSLVSRSSVAQQQINVRVLSYAGGGIGNLTLPNGSTFVDALAAIAPNPDNANLGRIALIRFDPEQGKAVTQELNGKRALRGDVSQNVPLQNNDVIVVGRNFISRITYALSNFTQPFRDILGFLLFFDSLRESATNLFEPGSDDNDD